MGFPQNIADEVFVRCGRHCCLCGKFAGVKMELHHIKQVADGGTDTIDNCIPLCLDCHAEVKSYNPRHPKGRQYTEKELKAHRDNTYRKYGPSISQDAEHNPPQTVIAALEKWVANAEGEKDKYLTWGLSEINSTCALSPGNIVLVGGVSGVGKSTYIQQMVMENTKNSINTVYFHLKESHDTIMQNILASESRTNRYNIERQLLTDEDWKRIVLSLESFQIDRLKLVPFSSQVELTEQVINEIEVEGNHIVVIDDFGALGIQSDTEAEAFLYRLKAAANRANTVVVILISLPYKVERMDKRPMIQDVPFESLIRMSDIVQFMHKRDDEFDIIACTELIVVKGCINGKYNTIELFPLATCPRFCILEKTSG